MTLEATDGIRFVIDDEDAAYVQQFSWRAYLDRTRPGRYGIERSEGGKNLLLHRELLSAPTGLCVDHINGDTLDNRRANLRLATNSENLRNRGKARHNTTGYKGVQRRPGRNRYIAQITFNGQTLKRYGFHTLEEAAAAYNELALQHHGEFARLNEL